MPRTQDLAKMRAFLNQCIDVSPGFSLKDEHEGLLVVEDENGLEYGLVLVAQGTTKKSLLDDLGHNTGESRTSFPVVYKDGAHAFVRLGRRGHIKTDRSLNRYSAADINLMVHLRDIEKELLGIAHNSKDTRVRANSLVYFQPDTARLKEGLRVFRADPVVLNYDHLNGVGKSRFVRDGEVTSRDYRKMVELTTPYEGGVSPLHFAPISGSGPSIGAVYPERSRLRATG